MLALHQVSVSIAGIKVLRDVSVTISGGKSVAVVGRNGAGKTTLLRAIMGLQALEGGTTRFGDADITMVPAHRRAALGMGYAPENRVLFPHFTVEENLRFPCEAQCLPSADIQTRLDEVISIVPELASMLPRSAAALSGGQGKMAALGRALMVGTRLVMLDEPFQGLASVLAAQYATSLRKLTSVRPGLAVLITESNGDLLKDVQDETFILERGELSGERRVAA